MRSEFQGDDPLHIWHQWFPLAVASEPNDPSAAALATATPNGMPSVRMVLVKRVDSDGFRFFTNAQSRKGTEIAFNPRAALCFHWKSLRRQVRVAGTVEQLPERDADEYFHSRSRGSQIAAAISDQSRPLADAAEMQARFTQFARAHEGQGIPRPAYWRGYRLIPSSIEFWIDGADRLHDRRIFERSGSEWTSTRLYP